MMCSRIDTRLGKAWDEWRRAMNTDGFLWYIPGGGIQSLAISETNPSGGDHALVSGQNVGWLSREQFMARLSPAAHAVPVLDSNGN